MKKKGSIAAKEIENDLKHLLPSQRTEYYKSKAEDFEKRIAKWKGQYRSGVYGNPGNNQQVDVCNSDEGCRNDNKNSKEI